MTEPQRHKLVAGVAIGVAVSVVLYLILFGLRVLDMKALLLGVGFFAMALKITTIKHKRNPMI